MIRVEANDATILSDALVSVHGTHKEISFELAALAAQLVRHNMPVPVIMASISFGLTHAENFEED